MRLGHEKALETVGDRSLIERVVSSLSFLKSKVIVVAAAEPSLSCFADCPNLKVVTDVYPGKGPLGGIYTGLVASDSPYNLVVACDMPFLNQALLGYMIGVSDGFDLVIPRLEGMIEPLHAVYTRVCLPLIKSLLEQGNLSIRALFPSVRVRYVEAVEINRFDPGHLSFFNINNKADLARARRIAGGDTNGDKR